MKMPENIPEPFVVLPNPHYRALVNELARELCGVDCESEEEGSCEPHLDEARGRMKMEYESQRAAKHDAMAYKVKTLMEVLGNTDA